MDTPEINIESSAQETAAPPVTEISNPELVRAALNQPTATFTLGDRTFEIKDLGYDDYIAFVALLEPLIKGVMGRAASAGGVEIPGISLETNNFSAGAIATYCGKSLPEMVRIICSQTDPNITVEEVKKLGKTPFKLAAVIMKQVVQNGIIRDFTDFFGQILPLLKTS